MSAFAPLINDMIAKATERVERQHALAKTIKAAGGSNEDLKNWIDNATDPEIVQTREAIAKALAKVQELRDGLMEKAKAANESDVDVTALQKDFKEEAKNLKAFLMSSQTSLRGLEVPEEDLKPLAEMVENLPTLSGGVSASGRSPEELSQIREWAAANGIEVAAKGRVSKEVLEAYDKAHATN